MAINTLYMDNGVLKSAGNVYHRQTPGNVRLENFFQPAVFSLLQKRLHNSKYALKFHPYKYRYFTAKSSEISMFLHGRYFKSLVRKVAGIKNYRIMHEVRKFEPGSYTLLHDTEKEKNRIDFVIDFSKTAENFGGYTVYLTESEELLSLNPSPNTLAFVERSKCVMKYTKYV